METLKKPIIYKSEYSLLKLLFILFGAGFTSTMLLLYSYSLGDLIPSTNLTREYIICFGQIIFQGAILLAYKRDKKLLFDYTYNLIMVSFIGGLLLLPVIFSALIFFPLTPGPYYFLAYFMLVVMFMFFNHKKRVKKIEAPHWLTYTWILYRVIVLIAIL